MAMNKTNIDHVEMRKAEWDAHKKWNKHVSEMIGSGVAMRNMQEEQKNKNVATRGYVMKKEFVYDKTAKAALF